MASGRQTARAHRGGTAGSGNAVPDGERLKPERARASPGRLRHRARQRPGGKRVVPRALPAAVRCQVGSRSCSRPPKGWVLTRLTSGGRSGLPALVDLKPFRQPRASAMQSAPCRHRRKAQYGPGLRRAQPVPGDQQHDSHLRRKSIERAANVAPADVCQLGRWRPTRGCRQPLEERPLAGQLAVVVAGLIERHRE